MEVILISALHFERLMSDIPALRYIWTLLRPVEHVVLKQNIVWYQWKQEKGKIEKSTKNKPE